MTAADRRVAFLITGLNHGGAETQLVRLVTVLRSRGWEILVVSLLPCGVLERPLMAVGVRVESLGIRRATDVLRASWSLVRLLRRWRPATLVSFLFHANLLGRVAGRLGGVPVVISAERSDRFGGRHRYWLLRLTDRLASATVTNSRLVGERLVRERVIHPDRLRVIPNAVDDDRSVTAPVDRRAVREAMGVRGDEFLWLAVGRLDPTKDYPTLLRAFDRHRRTDPRARLRIAGAGDADEPNTGLPRALRPRPEVDFLGHRTDVRALLAAADGFVMSSRLEGFPNALMEALAAGLPAVATRVGGIPEIVEDGVSGFVVPPGDVKALAEALGRLSGLPAQERRRMGEAGQRHILRLCSLPTVVRLWEALIEHSLPYDPAAGSPPSAGTKSPGARQSIPSSNGP
jgi:glycosyltransferase involved in cell wall biosynthesis